MFKVSRSIRCVSGLVISLQVVQNIGLQRQGGCDTTSVLVGFGDVQTVERPRFITGRVQCGFAQTEVAECLGELEKLGGDLSVVSLGMSSKSSKQFITVV